MSAQIIPCHLMLVVSQKEADPSRREVMVIPNRFGYLFGKEGYWQFKKLPLLFHYQVYNLMMDWSNW